MIKRIWVDADENGNDDLMTIEFGEPDPATIFVGQRAHLHLDGRQVSADRGDQPDYRGTAGLRVSRSGRQKFGRVCDKPRGTTDFDHGQTTADSHRQMP